MNSGLPSWESAVFGGLEIPLQERWCTWAEDRHEEEDNLLKELTSILSGKKVLPH